AQDLKRRRAEAQARLRARQEELARQHREEEARRQELARIARAAHAQHRPGDAARPNEDVIQQSEIGGGRLIPVAPSAGRAAMPGSGRAALSLEPGEIRRAIVLSEVLGPPVAVRALDQAPGENGVL